MNAQSWLLVVAAAAWLAGCATPPPIQADEEYEPPMEVKLPAPMVEYPPIEPVEPIEAVEPPPVAPEPPAAPPSTPVPAEPAPQPPPSSIPATPAVPVAPEISAEEQQMALLLVDLQRYGALPNEDLRRELGTLTQTLARQRTDANRIRLAMVYTLAKANPQDDQRALQLLENVAKSGGGSPAVKQLAAVLQSQISERIRAVREEQQKAEVVIQKLEALRNMERSLLRERVRSGGGGGGGGGGGSSGGGGGH